MRILLTTQTTLNLSGGVIDTQGILELAESLKQNTTLTQLDLSGNSIVAEGGRALAESLKRNMTLTELNLSRNFIGAKGGSALAESLKWNTTLSQLNLYDNSIRVEGTRVLAESLKENTTLTQLNVSGNFIGAEGTRALAESLKENMTLTKLSLYYNEIGDEGARALAEALAHNTSLSQLNLSNNGIGNEGASALAKALKQNTALTHLELSGNKIAGFEIITIDKALKRNETLADQNINDNGIGDEQALTLAVSLEQNATATTLNFRHNRIGQEGARVLSKFLKQNTTVTTLILQDNGIGHEGARALAMSLKHNTSVITLNLKGNGIGDDGSRALASSLMWNTTVTTLNLDYNEIGDEGARALTESLKKNATVTTLYLQHNGIGHEGARKLAELIERNTTVTALNLNYNGIGNDGARALANSLQKNLTVTKLNLQQNRISDETLAVIYSFLERNSYFAKSKSDLDASRQLQLVQIMDVIKNADIKVMSKFKPGFPSNDERLLECLTLLKITELAPCMTWIPYNEFTQVEKLGEGGFGIVYKAKVNGNRKGGRFVALKMLKGNDYVIDQLRNEVLLNIYLRLCSNSRRVATPAIFGVSMNENTGCYILVMEYAAGGDLTNLLAKSQPNSWLNIWRIAIEITRRLQVIHTADLIHNDLHPGNIVFIGTANNNPMIVDVGISNTVQHFREYDGRIYGRIEYLPPEAFTTISLCTKKSDIYCLGTLLWQLTARCCPRGNAMCPPNAISTEMREEPIPGTPTEYSDIYKRCWNSDPKLRPTIDEVLQNLEAIETEIAGDKWLDDVPEALAHLEKMQVDIHSGDSEFAFVDGSISRYHTKDDLERLSKGVSKDEDVENTSSVIYTEETSVVVDEINLESINVVATAKKTDDGVSDNQLHSSFQESLKYISSKLIYTLIKKLISKITKRNYRE